MNRSLLLLLLALALAGCTGSNAATPAAERPIPVRLAAVAVDRVAQVVTATGTLGPKEDVMLSFKIGGVVARILVDEGESVRAGQVLAELDHGEIDPAVAQAQSAADKAERDLARARRLFADSVATLEQVQDAETGRDVARAALASASFNRSHAVIVAPAAGVILKREAEPGELVQAGAPILALGSNARGQVVRVGLADRDAVRIHRGDRASVRFDALPERTFDGVVSEIAAAADPQTGAYRVEIALRGVSGAGRGLASGLVGAVGIALAADSPVALVPAEAVLEADGAHGVVFTPAADGRHAVRHAVTIAFLSGDRIAIASGLAGARAVIVDGAANLGDGSRIEVEP
jgi:RND family efflux transporter MFP subunit